MEHSIQAHEQRGIIERSWCQTGSTSALQVFYSSVQQAVFQAQASLQGLSLGTATDL